MAGSNEMAAIIMMQFDIQSQHTLDAVGTENYMRYGVAGPRRYLTNSRTEHHPTPRHIQVKVILQNPPNPSRPIADLVLERKDYVPERHTAWQGESTDAQLHLLWVWDFYRITSFLHLRLVAENAEELVPDYRPLTTATEAATLLLIVEEGSGSIRQLHHLKVNAT
jgi:hypothetical protein